MYHFDLDQLSPLQGSEIPSADSDNFLYVETLLGENKKGFRCLFPGCEKTFRFRSDMKRHTLIHTRDRPYICQTCKKEYKRPDALRNHMQTHNQNTIYSCTESGCNAQFRQINALQCHLLKHNSKRFVCDFEGCQKSFFTFQHLEQHQSAEYHQKLTQSSNQTNLNGLSYCLDPFEDLAPECGMNIPPSLIENSFEENFSCPKPQKFLHTKEGRDVSSLKLGNTTSGYLEAPPEVNLSDLQEPSKLDFGNFFQLTICKYLLQENKKMRARLDIQTDSIKEKFEKRLLSRLDKALSSQFDLKDLS